MGINKESDIAANLQIGPTSEGMVRIYVEADGGIELPLDFEPEEAEDIAAELQAAAEAARLAAKKGAGKPAARQGAGQGQGTGSDGRSRPRPRKP